MATKVIINTINNVNVQFESKEEKKLRIENKLRDYYDSQHSAFLVSHTPINKWTINTEIEHYRDLERAVMDNLPSEQYKLVINGIDDWKQGKYYKLYTTNCDTAVYIYPLTTYGDFVIRKIFFNDVADEVETTFNIERFKYASKYSLPTYLKIEKDGECFDLIQI